MRGRDMEKVRQKMRKIERESGESRGEGGGQGGVQGEGVGRQRRVDSQEEGRRTRKGPRGAGWRCSLDPGSNKELPKRPRLQDG